MTSTSWPTAIAWQMSQIVARLLGRPVHAVQALGEDPGDRRLADAAGAAEEVGVGDPVQPDRVAERLDDVVLADDVLEPLGPVAAGDDGVADRVGLGRASAGFGPSGSGHEARSVGPVGGRASAARRSGRRSTDRQGAGRAGEVLPGT